ncbi:hypothetical protein GPLA_0635 [Paraglaciecola polaris LMG 21857]|uniref:Uncharacterized protein n=1 Tax=Paraglaciecola polaris LMG 21857 TaxID=1129793 RepID=K6Z5R7_9ALTE|nr:hypothetical protein GPLA_0635 [Paraglaciecola polaris LMG 21857]
MGIFKRKIHRGIDTPDMRTVKVDKVCQFFLHSSSLFQPKDS